MALFRIAWNLIDDFVAAYFSGLGKIFEPLFLTLNYPGQNILPIILLVIAACAGLLFLFPVGYLWAQKLKYGPLQKSVVPKVVAGLAMAGMILVGLSVLTEIFLALTDPMFRSIFEDGTVSPVFVSGYLIFLFSVATGVSILVWGWVFFIVRFAEKLLHTSWPRVEKIAYGVVLFLGFYSSIFFWQNIDDPNFPYEANILHAAIKNTCLYDAKQENCPHQLSDIGIVEPVHFAAMARRSQMRYSYDPATNQYTFIIRYSKRVGIVYDQRLLPTQTVDLKVVYFDTFGADKIKDPPAYPGPWDNWPDWDPQLGVSL